MPSDSRKNCVDFDKHCPGDKGRDFGAMISDGRKCLSAYNS